MAEIKIHQQQHGYKNGHQLLASSSKLSREDQDVVDRLSDLAGSLRPGEMFAPYLTGYPLPSRKYYVLARTWQDLVAPRSGCVLTHSLLVPMEVWEVAPCIASLVALLRPVDLLINDKTLAPLILPELCESLPPVGDSRITELVEALFLEKRQPIVMFDVPEAEIIAERLLTAFWPGLRGGFCVSTYALAPRTLDGRAFDLLFAPKTARSRFTEWKGRRIDVEVTSPNSSRHRWTDSTAQKIFKSDEPSLLSSDALGVLRHDDKGDESALRLSLLWSELLEKSETSHNATLGMLDVLNSQNTAFGNTLIRVTPLIEKGIHLAKQSLPDAEVWEYMVTLLGKFSIQQPPAGILRALSRTSTMLAETGPEIALQFLKRHDVSNQAVSSTLLAGLARGLTHSSNIASITNNIMQLSPTTGLHLIALSPSFSKFMAHQTTVKSSTAWIYAFNTVLDTNDVALRSRARRNIVPHLNNPAQAPLLATLLKDIDSKSLMSVVSKIWENTRFEIEEFDVPLCSSADDKEKITDLRASILSVDETAASNRFLLSTLRLTMSDIEWLSSSAIPQRERARNLLNILLSQADDYTLKSVIDIIKTCDILLTMLLVDIKPVAVQLARVLIFGKLPIRQFLDIGLQVLPCIEGEIRKDLIFTLLSRGLSEASIADDDLLKKTLIIASNIVEPSQLIVMAIPLKGTTERISNNVLLLNGVKGVLRKEILAKVDELTVRLTHRKRKKFDASAIIAWASMLEESGEISRVAQLRAAGVALPYALCLLNTPVSPLIVAAFPVIYDELRTGKETPDLFDIFFFTDWDRCKAARRDLVNAYIKSTWPPADLLLAATSAGDSFKILKRVTRQSNGKKYLEAIKNDLMRFPDAKRMQLTKELATYSNVTLSFEKRDK